MTSLFLSFLLSVNFSKPLRHGNGGRKVYNTQDRIDSWQQVMGGMREYKVDGGDRVEIGLMNKLNY